MNTYFTFAVSALAIVSSVYAEEVVKYSKKDCAKIINENVYTTLSPIVGSGNLTKCNHATGFNLAQSATVPSDDQTRKMCKYGDCWNLIAELKALDFPDCMLNISATGLYVNLFEMTTEFKPTCDKYGYTSGGVHSSRP